MTRMDGRLAGADAHPVPSEPVAIIGMAGRFPGAANVDAFWRNVLSGSDTISRFAPDELDDNYASEVRASAAYVPARPVLPDPDLFDAAFFGMHPREASLTDPQHRVFLECAWEALESAGYDPASMTQVIGVVGGCSLNTYFLNNVCRDRGAVEDFTSSFQLGDYPMLLGAAQDFLATRVAYKLDLRGPAMTLGTACSTSLTAVVQACQILQLRQADMMLAGGVSISFPQQRGYLYVKGGMASVDGTCRPFDADASGTVFGSGAGVVVLKRLSDALTDRDTIHAVIRGSSSNNDGARKVGFTAPSVEGQADVIRDAHRRAGLDASDIGYVECHGTATPLGDPIEVAALIRAFSDCVADEPFCALGSAKANVGHLDAAAGVTGLIKATMSVRDGVIPPLAHFSRPNPLLALETSPFYLNAERRSWKGGAPRRAGVTALGVGGTNVHLVIEQPPNIEPRSGTNDPEIPLILPLSARTPDALRQSASALASRIEADQSLDLADVAHTLRNGRRAFEQRAAVTCRDRQDAIVALRDPKLFIETASAAGARIVFMCPGQGAQYGGMGGDLYRTEAVYRSIVNAGVPILEPFLGRDIRDFLLDRSDPAACDAIHETRFAQPALFLTEYAVARLWMSWGVVPDVLVGHSVGEIVCAALSGTLSFPDALRFVAERGRLMQDMPGGAMLAVRLPEAELRTILPADLAVAAVNGPRGCVVSGPYPAITAFKVLLETRQISFRPVRTSHAFHSAMMDPVIGALERCLEAVPFRRPDIPFVSGMTGLWADPDQVGTGAYWARHCRETVRFADALNCAASTDKTILIETGPGGTLGRFAAQILPNGKARACLAPLAEEEGTRSGQRQCYDALAAFWRLGGRPDWAAIYGNAQRRVPLPTYPFERQRHWIGAPPVSRGMAPLSAQCTDPQLTSGPEMSHPAPVEPPAVVEPIDVFAQSVAQLLEKLSGDAFTPATYETSFLDLGLDSLFLAQVATQVQSTFGVPVTFRQLFGDLPSIGTLARHLAARCPVPPAAHVDPKPVLVAVVQPAAPVTAPVAASVSVPDLLRAQVTAMQALFAQQLQVLGTAPAGGGSVAVLTPPATVVLPASPAETPAPSSRLQLYQQAKAPLRALTAEQQRYIDDLVQRYTAKTPGSKQATSERRGVLADPRAASGFRQEWKEMVYPITCVQSVGSRILDPDENTYVDLVNGYGQTLFGHAPPIVVEAVSEQLARGFAIGPQSPLAGEVAEQIHRLTGNERVTFCNTGSEAVMAAMRVARTVTGRSTVVMFDGAYHGQFDEVLVKGVKRNGDPGAAPAAAGIPPASVANVVVLPYATDESLAWIRDHAETLAAVIVEPVQSRHPALVPTTFLGQLRAVTAAAGAALVFDEVVTGFRVHPGGAQALFGIRADLATYGKVVGGGLPIGILAGTRRFMDALDGGTWQYGDESCPEVAPTFFAGTFVRHPLALAAARAVLTHLERAGVELQETTRANTARLVEDINTDLSARGLVSRAESFSSWFYFNPAAEDRLASLFFYEARWRGLHIQEGFPCFLTTAHSEADLDHVRTTFKDSLDALASAGILCGTRPSTLVSPPATSVARSAPWTEPQKEIWLAAQLSEAASCAFNESVSLMFDGAMDEAALRRALRELALRHDALRVRFDPDTETMREEAEAELPLSAVNLLARPNAEALLAEELNREATTSFDLVAGPAARATLVRLSAHRSVLIFTAHHIICDGWSINLLIEEIAGLYAAHRAGRDSALPEAPSFLRYAQQQSRKDRRENHIFWQGVFATIPAPLDLPCDRPRPPQKSYRGATHCDAIPGQLVRNVKAAGARQGCTLFATLLAALQIVTARLSGENDVVIAIPVAGQSAAALPRLVGHCVSLLPIRATVAPTASLADHLLQTRDRVLDAFEHQDITFGTLVRTLEVPRSQNRLPLTQIQFNLEKVTTGPSLPDVTLSVTPNQKGFSNFDLFVNFIEEADGLRVDCDYSTDLFDAATIARWVDHLRQVFQAMADDPAQPIWRTPLMPAAEIGALMRRSEQAEAKLDFRSIPAVVADHAARTPEAAAILWRDRRMTYAELDSAVNRLASRLRERQLPSGGRIAIATGRSPMMIVAILAVMQAGHAYVPLDIAQPLPRQRMIVEDGRVAAVICDSTDTAVVFRDHMVIDITSAAANDDASPLNRGAVDAPGIDDTAYVIFTSGSTGRPKGVEIPHGALHNLLRSMMDRPGFTPRDTWLAVTTIAFDIAAAEMLVPLLAGGRVVIADRAEVTDGFALVSRIADSGATVVQATPSLWRMLVEAGFRSHPGLTMIAGGEPLPRDLADLLLAGGGCLWNAYGPTETTIWSSFEAVRPNDRPISIGQPVLGTQMFVLDARLQLVPIGMEGELFIGGAGLAKGYFERADLTADAFPIVSLPSAPPQRLYRTGDRAKRLPDGAIQVLGRNDGQVKLRGFRIELGEVEAVLRRCPGVADAAVVLDSNGSEGRLVGYIVESGPDMSDPAGFVARHLPDFMLPKTWVRLQRLPVTPNGKLDRAALPAPETAIVATREVLTPRTPIEARLSEIFGPILRLNVIGVHDNLFALGADSIQIFRIAARLRAERLGLDASDLMRMPTIAELAEVADRRSAEIIDIDKVPSLRSFRRKTTSTKERID